MQDLHCRCDSCAFVGAVLIVPSHGVMCAVGLWVLELWRVEVYACLAQSAASCEVAMAALFAACRFDYFGLTMGDGPVKYEKMAVLVSHPDLGSTVLEVSPPPH